MSQEGAQYPSADLCYEEVLQGKRYIVIANTNEVLTVYRVLNSGLLKRLRRWSKELVAVN